LADAALRTPGAVDSDVQAALAALIRTHRTSESGLLYETRAEDRIAAAVQGLFERSLADYQKTRQEQEGLSPFRNAEILGVLVFLERSAISNRNGRPKGRAYIDFVRERLNISPEAEAQSALVT
jgi:hypothetical protein